MQKLNSNKNNLSFGGKAGFSLSTKIYAVVGVLVFMIFFGSLVAFSLQRYLISKYEGLQEVQFAQREAAMAARFQTVLSVQEMKNYMIRRDPKYAEAFRAAVDKADRQIVLYGKLAVSPEEKKMSDEAKGHLLTHSTAFEAAVKAHNGNPKITLDQLDTITKLKNRPVSQLTDKMYGLASEETAKGQKSLQKIASMSGVVLICGSMSIALIVTIIVIIFTRKILLSIREAVDAAMRIADGDLTVSVAARTNDEIGLMMNKLKEMVDRFRKIVADLKQSSASIQSGSQHLNLQSGEMTLTLSQQGSRANQIATAAEEMAQTVVDIARNTANMADSAAGTSAVADEGARIVEKSVTESKAIAEAVMLSAKVVETLGEKSKQIGDIVHVINDIADQTNLLALNAAIEAARAGEQGRGFAVVADEVRKLAERTAKATSEIGGMIHSIQYEVTHAVQAMQSTNERVDAGAEYSIKAGEQLRKIVASVASLQSIVQQIASATEEISATSESISGDIHDIAGGVNNLSGGSVQVAQSSAELATLADQLRGVVDQFKV